LQLKDEAEDRGGVRRSNELGVLVEGEGVREDGSRRARNLLPAAVTVCIPRPRCGCLGLALQVVDPVSGGTHRSFSLSVRCARAACTSASSRSSRAARSAWRAALVLAATARAFCCW